MLVLSRKLGEVIHIGDNITVTVVDIDRGKIRLGIHAPRNVPIYRQELIHLKPYPPKESNSGDTHPQGPQTTDGVAGIRASEVPGG